MRVVLYIVAPFGVPIMQQHPQKRGPKKWAQNLGHYTCAYVPSSLNPETKTLAPICHPSPRSRCETLYAPRPHVSGWGGPKSGVLAVFWRFLYRGIIVFGQGYPYSMKCPEYSRGSDSTRSGEAMCTCSSRDGCVGLKVRASRFRAPLPLCRCPERALLTHPFEPCKTS